MNPDDFGSRFENMSASQLPPPPDAYQIAAEVIRREQRNIRVLAFLCVFFWLAAVAGMLALIYGLNQFVLFIRVAPGMPWSFVQDKPVPLARLNAESQEMMLWGTSFIHHSIPYLAASAAALMLAAMSTVRLIVCSRRATLNRINLSLAQLSESLQQMRRQFGKKSD